MNLRKNAYLQFVQLLFVPLPDGFADPFGCQDLF